MNKEQGSRPEVVRIKELDWVDRVVSAMDDRFGIPGTNIRFGADAIIGLVPWLGDAVSVGISGMLVVAMARRGASGMVLVRMLLNVVTDYLLGAVPLLGDLFDFSFKANRRNLRLLREHYEQGKHQGSAWWVLGLILLIFLALVGLSVWLLIRGVNGLLSLGG